MGLKIPDHLELAVSYGWRESLERKLASVERTALPAILETLDTENSTRFSYIQPKRMESTRGSAFGHRKPKTAAEAGDLTKLTRRRWRQDEQGVSIELYRDLNFDHRMALFILGDVVFQYTLGVELALK